jgi:hypothetical protein
MTTRQLDDVSALHARWRGAWWIVAMLIAPVVLLAVVAIPWAYVKYHKVQFALAETGALGSNDADSVARMKYHCERLVDAGVYTRVRYGFRHVMSDSQRANETFVASAAQQSWVYLEPLDLERGQPLVITVTCAPEDAPAWQVFLAAQDVP